MTVEEGIGSEEKVEMSGGNEEEDSMEDGEGSKEEDVETADDPASDGDE